MAAYGDDALHGEMGRFTRLYALYGALFGLLFPFGATVIEAALVHDLSVGGLVAAQRGQPLLWIIDSAPFWLGLFAAFGGYRQDVIVAAYQALERANTALEATNTELGRANEELLRAQALKSQFLANVSHELRTPLNAIIGFSKILLRKTKGSIDARQTRNLELVHESGQHLLEIVNDLLDIERIEAGTLTVKPEVVDVRSLVDDVVGSVQPRAQEKQLTVLAELDARVSQVTTDPGRLRQVLLNLIVNAIKYSDTGTIRLRAAAEGTWLRFDVTDQGIGIPADALPHVFEAFRQVDGSATRAQGGVGLGLHLVKHLTSLLGGTIDVTSEVGVGSTFTLKLPLPVVDTAAGEAAAPATRGEGPLVLAIDDQLEALQLIQGELVEAGFRVSTALSGPEGLAKARAERPELIVLDIVMPAMDGWAVLKEIRRSPDLSATPVIISSFLDASPVAMRMGSVAWLTKPFDVDEFRGVVGALEIDCKDVLVVEDDAATRALVIEQLTDAGAIVRSAADGAEAMAAIAAKRPCAMVLDLGLPLHDGFEVLARLRELEDGDAIPVVVYTARDLDPHDLARLQRGPVSIVGKGTTQSVSELAGRVRQALQAEEIA